MLLHTGFEIGQEEQNFPLPAGGGQTVVTTSPRTGTYCLEWDATASGVGLIVTLNGNIGYSAGQTRRLMPIRIGFGFYIVTKSNASHNIIAIEVSGVSPQWREVGINSSGDFLLANVSEIQIGTTLTGPGVNVWRYFLCDFSPWYPYYCRIWYRDTGAGGWTSWIDESVRSDGDVDAPTGQITDIYFGNAGKAAPTTGKYRYDDLCIELPDAMASGRRVWQGFQMGMVGHKLLVPNGDVTTQWTPTPAGTHYTTVDEQPPDVVLTDYLKATAASKDDLLDLAAAVASKTPKSAKVLVKGSNEGTLNQDNFFVGLDDGGVMQDARTDNDKLDETAAPVTTAAPDPAYWERSPDGSSSWTETKLNGARVLLRTKTAGAGYDYRVWQASVEECYEDTAPPTRDYKGANLINRPASVC